MDPEREAEIRPHERKKKDVEAHFLVEIVGIFSDEGLTAGIIAIVQTILLAIIALLAAPEPAISKVTASLLAAGVGLLAVVGSSSFWSVHEARSSRPSTHAASGRTRRMRCTGRTWPVSG